MKKNLLIVLILGISFSTTTIQAQKRKCGTMHILEQRIKNDPSIGLRMEQSEVKTQENILLLQQPSGAKQLRQIITIPVVVHVIYHNSTENISNAQIKSQIDILNEDFRLLNPDSLYVSHPFWPYTADAGIEFCLASRDPSGLSTNGITRTYTDSVSFVGDGNEKYSASGGKDNWNPTKYLNLWVCNLAGSGGTLGYSAFPSDLSTYPDDDGVVIRYEAFGTIGVAGSNSFSANDGGRTATHEVGHWLNLHHIWGDNQPSCGDDFVGDTEPADSANYGCPAFPLNDFNACGTGAAGVMFMNYMDYVDDACMNMFTGGQALRMHSALNYERAGILTSLGCGGPINIQEISFESSIDLYPNPSAGNFTINTNKATSDKIRITVFDVLGGKIQQFENVSSFPFQLHLNELSDGVYFIKIDSGFHTTTKKVFIYK